MKLAVIFVLVVLSLPMFYGQDKRGNGEFVTAFELKEFARLKRLVSAVERMEFANPENRIRTWKQHNAEGVAAEADPGLGITIDADEWKLDRVKGVWKNGWNDYDLANVVVITEAGKHIQFIDMTDANIKKVEDVPIRRGDAVIFLKNSEAK